MSGGLGGSGSADGDAMDTDDDDDLLVMEVPRSSGANGHTSENDRDGAEGEGDDDDDVMVVMETRDDTEAPQGVVGQKRALEHAPGHDGEPSGKKQATEQNVSSECRDETENDIDRDLIVID